MDDRQPVLKPVVNASSADFNHKMETRPIGGSVGAGWVGPVSGRSNVIRLSEPQIHAVSEPADSVSINIVPIPDVRLQSGAVVQKMKDLENNCTDRLEMHRASLPNTSSPAMAGQKPKKGSFQITSVINRKQLDNIDRTYEDADSIGDDYDETNTEDLSSEIMDTSKMTDIDQDPSSEDTVQSLVVEDHNATATRPAVTVPNSLSIARDKTRHESPPSATSGVTGVSGMVTETENAGNSGHASKEDDASFGATRFRIVKVSNERYVRGRWSCYDYQDSERTNRDEIGSGNSSTASSVHYGGDDNTTKNTFPATSGTALYTNGTPVLISAEVMASAPKGDYTPMVIGTGVADTSGAPHMAPVVSQPISSNQPAPAYGTPTDYMAPMPPSSQSIPQPAQQTQPMTQNLNTAVSVAPSDSVDLVAKPALHHTGALGAEFPPTSGSPSAGISPNDNLQAPATEFRPVPTDNKQAPPVNDTETADGTGVSEVGVAKALMTQAGLTQPLLEMVQTMHYPLGTNRDDDESGASTVAIDNKIEQAMDLVKSHLMFAVREEVLVLKEQIKELLEKNSQLEYENTVLRAGASPETLAKLSQANPTQTQTSTS